jgi:pimeloyl-ACP methyl ester carboxylesterase
LLSPPDPLGAELARAVTGDVPRRDVRVVTPELELHCVIWGREQDPPVLLVHGSGAHAHWWDPLVPALVRGRRLIALDSRGHGQSGRPREIAYRLADHERDLAAVLDALAPGPVPLIAHSMGARASLYFAARHPERVAGLALIDTTLSGLDEQQVAAFREKIRNRRDGPGYPSHAEALAAYRLVPEESGVPEAVMRDVAHHALIESPPGTWRVRFDRGVLLGDGSHALFDELARVRCPLRIAYARRAPRPDSSELDAARARAPSGTLVEEFEGGHHLFLARPGPIGVWLAGFLDSLARGA